MAFKPLRATKKNGTFSVDLEEFDERELMEGDVLIAVDYSTVNYKDGLAITNRVDIIRRLPLIPGADLSGTVEASAHAGVSVGNKVVVNCWGLGQTHHYGGFAQKARVPGDWVVKVPDAFTTRDAMAVGTAGYTSDAGGAGSGARRHHARPRRRPRDRRQRGRGLHRHRAAVPPGLPRDRLDGPPRGDRLSARTRSARGHRSQPLAGPGAPIAKEHWAGAIDTVGSHTLANVLAQTQYRSVVAAFGLAQGADLPGSVLPFILRNVTLAGIDAVNAPQAVRAQGWARLVSDFDLGKLARTAHTVGLADVPDVARRILEGQVQGRTVVDVNA